VHPGRRQVAPADARGPTWRPEETDGTTRDPHRRLQRDLEKARDEFLVLVSQHVPADGTLGIVVFDAHRDPAPPTTTGRTGSSTRHGLQIVFARDSADAWMQQRMREHPEPANLTIVTADREILETARAHGCTILRVSEFLHLKSKRRQRLDRLRSSEKPEHQSPREIEEWRRLFEKPRDDE
jgi:predicted RNA-binding protein with PIN domain